MISDQCSRIKLKEKSRKHMKVVNQYWNTAPQRMPKAGKVGSRKVGR